MTIAHLIDPMAQDRRLFGNKAANLALAISKGMPVPLGFAIAHGGHIDSANLEPYIQKLDPPYAVRSSSLAEDGTAQAFAGVFDTVLGVLMGQDILQAVLQVRASAHGPNVQSYLGRSDVDVSMAVIVQHLVDAQSAGVAFSRDPVSGTRTVVIESAYGLGKSVVDGEVTPDSHEFSHAGKLLQKSLGTKKTRLDFNGDIARSDVSPDMTGSFALDDEQAQQVCQLTLQAERTFHCPIDIEWAIDRAGALWLLQARPITALATQTANPEVAL